MGKSVNKVILLGYVGKQPDIRTTGSSGIVANFSIATTDRQKDKQGEWQDSTDWHNLTAFSKLAEIVRDYVVKGTRVYVEGKLKTQTWDDKNTGEKKYKAVIFLSELVVINAAEEKAPPSKNEEISDDDIPF